VLIQQKELIIDGKVKTRIATLDLPTLKFSEEAQYLAQGAGSGGSGSGVARQKAADSVLDRTIGRPTTVIQHHVGVDWSRVPEPLPRKSRGPLHDGHGNISRLATGRASRTRVGTASRWVRQNS